MCIYLLSIDIISTKKDGLNKHFYPIMARTSIQIEFDAKTPDQNGSHSSRSFTQAVRSPPKMRPREILIGIRMPPRTSIGLTLRYFKPRLKSAPRSIAQ